ncbi:hypothetical protein D3C78_1312600 [compost metagenome]
MSTRCSNSDDAQSTATIISPAENTPSISVRRLTDVLPSVSCRLSSSCITPGSRPRLASTATPQASQEKICSNRRAAVEFGKVLDSTRTTKRITARDSRMETAMRSQNTGW